MHNKDEKSFSYTYSAKEQEEIKAIRKKYSPPQEDKMTQLRRLDESVTKKASAVSLCIGIIGALILGLGMSFTMTDIGKLLGSHQYIALPLGIVIGIIGIILVSLAYPAYNRILKKERERIAPDIIRLTDELMK